MLYDELENGQTLPGVGCDPPSWWQPGFGIIRCMDEDLPKVKDIHSSSHG